MKIEGQEPNGPRSLKRLSLFARRLLSEWRRLEALSAAESIVVAVSGGADSTALLLALDELMKAGRLRLKLLVAHLNHGLRGEAGSSDAQWVAELCRQLGHEIRAEQVSLKDQLSAGRDNLEQAARRARYRFLGEVAAEAGAGVVLTAHTLNDQAETFILRLLRGSGPDGLGCIERVRPLDAGGSVLLIRPLLDWAEREQTEEYCRERKVIFRQDEMNEDERFARVRVRKELLPLLQTFNPRAVQALGRTARLLRADASVLNHAAAELLARASGPASDGESSPPLSVRQLIEAPAALRRRALRQWIAVGRGDLRRIELVHLLVVERLLEGERGGRIVELPGGAKVARRRGLLRLLDAEKTER